MSDGTSENPKSNNDGRDVDLFNRSSTPSPFSRHTSNPPVEDNDPIEEFWATFSMITHSGERFSINICFRNRQHYNAEMHKFETAKNIHVTLKDINGESVVIKREMLLHVMPAEVAEHPSKKQDW